MPILLPGLESQPSAPSTMVEVVPSLPLSQLRMGEEGEEPLPDEEDGFFETQEYMDMECNWRRWYNVADELEDNHSLASLVTNLRTWADSLEALGRQGWQLDPDEPLAGGEEFALTNPEREREEWRLRRQRRREAMAEERRRQEEAAGGRSAGDDGAVGMETDGGPAPVTAQPAPAEEAGGAAAAAGAAGEGGAPASAPAAPSAAAAAAPKSPRPPSAQPAFVLF